MPAACSRLPKMNPPHVLPFPRSRRLDEAPTFIFFIASLLTSSPAHLCRAAEQDPRMVAPPNAVRGRLPGIAPTPARDAAKTFRVLDGIITDESAASLTLKRAEGVTETVLRGDIAQLFGSGLSLMPEGMETGITVEQMADLIAFLLPSQ